MKTSISALGALLRACGITELTIAVANAGTRAYRVKIAAWWALALRYRRLIVSLIILPTLALVAAGSWLVWTVTSLALGRQAASLAVVALVGTTFAISREFARRP